MVYRLVRNFILTNGKSRAFPLVYSKTPMLIPILLFVLSYAVLALVYVLAAIGAVWLRRRTERADLQHDLNRSSRHIYNEKHDNQHR